MPYIPRDQVEKAKEMDLLTYLKTFEPDELVHFAGNTYYTREHDSLKISNGKWYWFSRGIGGRSALDYLIKVKEMSFMDAVGRILGQAVSMPAPIYQAKKEPKKEFKLPQRCRYSNRVFSYLQGRGIDGEIIQFCMNTGQIYESYPYHNAVFVGFDPEGQPKYAALRGTESNFKGEAGGSDKRFSFCLPAQISSPTVHLFEAAIDLLSYATMAKMSGKDFRTAHLLSLAGVYKPSKEDSEITIPPALSQFLSVHPEIRQIVLRLDNDLTGQLAAKSLQAALSEKYIVKIALPSHGKDYNDMLCHVLGRSKTPERHDLER